MLQEKYNEALSERVPLMVDKNHLDDPHVKANLLFQVIIASNKFQILTAVSNFSSFSEHLLYYTLCNFFVGTFLSVRVAD